MRTLTIIMKRKPTISITKWGVPIRTTRVLTKDLGSKEKEIKVGT